MIEKKMAELIADYMRYHSITQVELARRSGASTKHINQVLNGKATARAALLDSWAYCLGLRFTVTLEAE